MRAEDILYRNLKYTTTTTYTDDSDATLTHDHDGLGRHGPALTLHRFRMEHISGMNAGATMQRLQNSTAVYRSPVKHAVSRVDDDIPDWCEDEYGQVQPETFESHLADQWGFLMMVNSFIICIVVILCILCLY